MFLRDGNFFSTFRTRPLKCDIHGVLSILDGGPDSVGSPHHLAGVLPRDLTFLSLVGERPPFESALEPISGGQIAPRRRLTAFSRPGAPSMSLSKSGLEVVELNVPSSRCTSRKVTENMGKHTVLQHALDPCSNDVECRELLRRDLLRREIDA